MPSTAPLTAALSPPASFFKRTPAPARAGEDTAAAATKPNSPPSAEDIARAFESSVYRKSSVASAVRLGFSQTGAKVGGTRAGGDGAAELVAQQLEFSFVREIRAVELAVFQQRSGGGDAEGGSAESGYLALSREVSARFEASVSFSSAALRGLSGSGAALAGDDERLGKLVSFARGLLEQADEAFQEVFALLGDFFLGSKEGAPFQAAFDTLLQQLQDAFNGFFTGGIGGGNGPGNAVAGQFRGVQLEFKFEFSASITVEAAEVQQSDPITFDLDDDGFELTSYTNGARFDILGSGQAVNTAFVTGGDAFLALDRNGNGSIDSGKELFGDQNGAANGYEELRKLDSNGDGKIDRNDASFGALRLFRDNGNGKTEPGELISLSEAGITEIALNYRNVDQRAAGGNRIAQVASFTRSDGTLGRAADVVLNYTA